ncbi:MAG TPA: glycosyltransferase [Anaerolineales bacterium]
MSKRVLFVVPYAPNLIRVRPYNLIRHLTERGNRVTVLTLWTSRQEMESLEQLKPFAERVLAVRLPRWRSFWNCALALPTRKPLQAVYCWEPALARQLSALAAPSSREPDAFDVVHVEHLRGAAYGLYLKSLTGKGRSPLPIVWDSVDSISLLFRQARMRSKSLLSRGMTWFELGRTERYEGWLLSQFNHVLITSRMDQQALLSAIPPGIRPPPTSVLRNGVDLDYFKPDPGITRDPDSVVISGKMSYHANITMVLHFVQAIMPQVWASRPDARLVVVGKDPPREIQALSGNQKITITGTVQHLPPFLQQATLAAAPIAYGVGIQNKVLEAMACATPVITTPQAISALDVQPGREVLVAEDPAVFAQAILDLLGNPAQRERLGQAGRCYVESHHNWAAVAAQLEDIYSQAIAGQ